MAERRMEKQDLDIFRNSGPSRVKVRIVGGDGTLEPKGAR